MVKKGFMILSLLLLSFSVLGMVVHVEAETMLDYHSDEGCETYPYTDYFYCDGNGLAGSTFSSAKYLGDITTRYLVYDLGINYEEYDWVIADGTLRAYNDNLDRRDVYSFTVGKDYDVSLDITLLGLSYDGEYELDFHVIKFNDYNLYNNLETGLSLDGNSIVAAGFSDENTGNSSASMNLSPGIYYIVIDGVLNNSFLNQIDYSLNLSRTSKTFRTQETVSSSLWGTPGYETIVWTNDFLGSNLDYISSTMTGLSSSELQQFYLSQATFQVGHSYFNKEYFFFTGSSLQDFSSTLQTLIYNVATLKQAVQANIGYQNMVMDIVFTVTSTGVTMALRALDITGVVAFTIKTAISLVVYPLIRELVLSDEMYTLGYIDDFLARIVSLKASIETVLSYTSGTDFISADNPFAIREMVYFGSDKITKYYYGVSSTYNYSSITSSDPVSYGLDITQDQILGLGLWSKVSRSNDLISTYIDSTASMETVLSSYGYPNYVELADIMLTESTLPGSITTIGESSATDNTVPSSASDMKYTYDVEYSFYSGGYIYLEDADYSYYKNWNLITESTRYLTMEQSQKHLSASGTADNSRYYKFRVNSTNTLEMVVNSSDSTVRFDLCKMSNSGSLVVIGDAEGNTGTAKNYLINPGEYYIWVHSSTLLDKSNANFSLKGVMNFVTHSIDEEEYDETYQFAQDLTFTTMENQLPDIYEQASVTGELSDITLIDFLDNYYRFGSTTEVYGSYRDIDYYEFTVDSPSNISIYFSSLTSDFTFSIVVFTAYNSVILSTATSTSSAINFQLNTGTYYIRINSSSSTAPNNNPAKYGFSISTWDNQPATMTLVGDTIQYVLTADGPSEYYMDSGAHVVDDSGLDTIIQGTGNVDLYTLGSYTRTYTYTDPFGLVTQTTREVRVYALQNLYQLQVYTETGGEWSPSVDNGIGYFSSYTSGTTIYLSNGNEMYVYGASTKQYNYSYKRYEYYDKVCLQKYQNDTTFGTDWNYIDEQIGSEFCVWVDTAYADDIGEDDNLNHYYSKLAFTYDGDTTLSTVYYNDKQDVSTIDDAYYYRVTSVTTNNYKNPNYYSSTTGFTSVTKVDGDSGDYYYDYAYQSATYTTVYGSTVTSYYRYASYYNLYVWWTTYAYIDVPGATIYAFYTPTAPAGYRYVDTGFDRMYWGQ